MERSTESPAPPEPAALQPAAPANPPEQSKLLAVLGGVLGFALTYFGLKLFSLQTRLHLYVGAAVGLVLAFIPHTIAKRSGQPRLALASLGAGLVAGAVGGALLALPVVLVLAFVAARKKPAPATLE